MNLANEERPTSESIRCSEVADAVEERASLRPKWKSDRIGEESRLNRAAQRPHDDLRKYKCAGLALLRRIAESETRVFKTRREDHVSTPVEYQRIYNGSQARGIVVWRELKAWRTISYSFGGVSVL